MNAINTTNPMKIDAATRAFNANLLNTELQNISIIPVVNGNVMTVTAYADTPNRFSGFLGNANTRVNALAEVEVVQSGNATTANVCILIKDPTSTQTFLANSGAVIGASTCNLDIAANSNPAAIFNAGVNLNFQKTCIRGNNIINNGGTVNNMQTNCTATTDPFVNTLPTPTIGACNYSNMNYTGVNNLSPGVYCGNFNFNGSGTLNLAPGLYIFNNSNWNVNNGWNVNGTDVTIYFANANSYIQINSGVNINIKAPTSGTYSDILIFEPNGLSPSSIAINGQA
jgi:hypothetical protein